MPRKKGELKALREMGIVLHLPTQRKKPFAQEVRAIESAARIAKRVQYRFEKLCSDQLNKLLAQALPDGWTEFEKELLFRRSVAWRTHRLLYLMHKKHGPYCSLCKRLYYEASMHRFSVRVQDDKPYLICRKCINKVEKAKPINHVVDWSSNLTSVMENIRNDCVTGASMSGNTIG